MVQSTSLVLSCNDITFWMQMNFANTMERIYRSFLFIFGNKNVNRVSTGSGRTNLKIFDAKFKISSWNVGVWGGLVQPWWKTPKIHAVLSKRFPIGWESRKTGFWRLTVPVTSDNEERIRSKKKKIFSKRTSCSGAKVKCEIACRTSCSVNHSELSYYKKIGQSYAIFKSPFVRNKIILTTSCTWRTRVFLSAVKPRLERRWLSKIG